MSAATPIALPAKPQQLDLLPEYSEARAIIERITRVDEAKSYADRATALRAYAFKAKDRALAAWATEVRLRAERKAGVLLIEARVLSRRQGPGRPVLAKNNSSARELFSQTLADIGISRKESMLWQRIARLPVDQFEARIGRLHNPETDPLFSSATDEWLTPKNILDRVVSVLGFIDLDPCASDVEPDNVPAKTRITKDRDGLAAGWRGNVFMNPPYGQIVDDWCEKLVREWKEGQVEKAIALVAARTDTRWWRMFRFAPVCLVSGRLKFRRPGEADEDSAPFPSAVFYLGPDKQHFIRHFAQLGEIRDAAIAG